MNPSLLPIPSIAPRDSRPNLQSIGGNDFLATTKPSKDAFRAIFRPTPTSGTVPSRPRPRLSSRSDPMPNSPKASPSQARPTPR